MEAAQFVITALLAAGLLSRRWRRHAVAAVCIWSVSAAVAAGVDHQWGWLSFYAVCGLGGLIGQMAGMWSEREGEPVPPK